MAKDLTSKKEYARWCELKLMEQGGLIEDLQRQVPFVLIDKSKYGRAITYVARFLLFRLRKTSS